MQKIYSSTHFNCFCRQNKSGDTQYLVFYKGGKMPVAMWSAQNKLGHLLDFMLIDDKVHEVNHEKELIRLIRKIGGSL